MVQLYGIKSTIGENLNSTRGRYMTNNIKTTFFLITIIVIAVSFITYFSNNDFEAINGFLDISDVDLSKGNVNLKGEWTYYHDVFLNGSETAEELSKLKKRNVIVPGRLEDNVINSYGYGTYNLKIRVGEGNKVYGIRVPIISSASKIYINGELISQSGSISESKDNNYIGQWRTDIKFFNVATEEIDIKINVANFSHRKGGLVWGNVVLGNQENICTSRGLSIAINFFAVGFLICISLYHFIYLLNRHREESYYFAMFCLCMAVRILITGDNYITDLVINMPVQLNGKLEYLSISLGAYYFIIFLSETKKDKSYKNTTFKILTNYLIGYSVLIIFTRIYLYSALIEMNFVIIMYFTIKEIYYYYKKEDTDIGEEVVFYTSIMFVICIINDMLYAYSYIDSYIIYIGILSVVIGHTVKVALDVAKDHDRVANWSKELDKEILSRTKELEILNNKLYYLATRDVLTGLYNRQYLEEWATKALTNKVVEWVIILYVDIDNFRDFNNRYGHQIGDMVLREFSEMIKTCVHKDGDVYRVGGDEFVVLIPKKDMDVAISIQQSILKSVKDGQYLISGIQQYIGKNIMFEQDDNIACTIGISDGKLDFDINEIIDKAADSMMNRR